MSTKNNKLKRRPRSHIIADLSVNHVEYHALNCGFSVERFEKDYGYDLNLYTYTTKGEPENEAITIQLKASDKLDKKAKYIHFNIDTRDIRNWRSQVLPMILILYDAPNEVGYWLYIQEYFQNLSGFKLNKNQKTFTVKVPKNNVIDNNSMKGFQTFKRKILAQINKVTIKHTI